MFYTRDPTLRNILNTILVCVCVYTCHCHYYTQDQFVQELLVALSAKELMHQPMQAIASVSEL